MTRVAYGILRMVDYDPANSEHAGRPVMSVPDGNVVSGCWGEMIGKVGKLLVTCLVTKLSFCIVGCLFE